MIPVIEAKCTVLAKGNHKPCKKYPDCSKICKMQGTTNRCCANDCLQLCCSIQRAANTGNIRSIYYGIEKAMGPKQSRIAPLKSKPAETIQYRHKSDGKMGGILLRIILS